MQGVHYAPQIIAQQTATLGVRLGAQQQRVAHIEVRQDNFEERVAVGERNIEALAAKFEQMSLITQTQEAQGFAQKKILRTQAKIAWNSYDASWYRAKWAKIGIIFLCATGIGCAALKCARADFYKIRKTTFRLRKEWAEAEATYQLYDRLLEVATVAERTALIQQRAAQLEAERPAVPGFKS